MRGQENCARGRVGMGNNVARTGLDRAVGR